MVRAFVEAGIPEDVFVNLFLTHDVTSQLIADGCFNFINFTGSVEGGRAIERAAAGSFAGLGLELGGKDHWLCDGRRQSGCRRRHVDGRRVL